MCTSTKKAKPFIEYEEIVLEEIDEEKLYNFIYGNFSKEFDLNIETSKRIIENMQLYEVLIERYWDEYYKERKEKGNGTK